jgi:hypothetical protein
MADCLGGGRLSHDAALAPRRLYHRQSCGVYGSRYSGVEPGGTSVPRVEGRVGAERHGRARRPFMNIQAHRADENRSGDGRDAFQAGYSHGRRIARCQRERRIDYH